MLQNDATKRLVIKAKIPYLIRRKNVFYFRLGVPAELRGLIQSREIIQSLRTQSSDEAQRKALALAAHFKTLLHDLKTGKRKTVSKSELFNISKHSPDIEESASSPTPFNQIAFAGTISKPTAPTLLVVVDDFLKRYDTENRAILGKLNATLPIIVELIGNKPINEIFQTDINEFFDEV